MAALLRAVRGALSLAAVALWLAAPGVAIFYVLYMPRVWLWPGRRRELVSSYMKLMSRGIFGLLGLGGARFRRTGTIPTGQTVLVLMNHQSLLDVPTATLMAEPYVPAFVTRRRYARFIPSVSPAIRLLECPLVDPKRDPRGALGALRRAAPAEKAGLLIYPEGHRTLDGEVRPFRTAGALAVLEARRMPVYLVVTDGFWKSRRFVDFVTSVPDIRGETEVLGPFAPPESDDELPAFLQDLRGRMVEHLALMRTRAGAA
jgi:1-acyl-sn-glycerol-3-phosphate acyltransferase